MQISLLLWKDKDAVSLLICSHNTDVDFRAVTVLQTQQAMWIRSLDTVCCETVLLSLELP